MRVYLAATAEQLRELADGRSPEQEWHGFAPLDTVRAALGGVGDEELEYALSVAAGEASAALGSDGVRAGRRFVVVAEFDERLVSPDRDAPGAVVVRAAIASSEVDAILAGESDGGVAAAAGEGELGWFGAQEIADLLA
jgi:hypothetical protein